MQCSRDSTNNKMDVVVKMKVNCQVVILKCSQARVGQGKWTMQCVSRLSCSSGMHTITISIHYALVSRSNFTFLLLQSGADIEGLFTRHFDWLGKNGVELWPAVLELHHCELPSAPALPHCLQICEALWLSLIAISVSGWILWAPPCWGGRSRFHAGWPGLKANTCSTKRDMYDDICTGKLNTHMIVYPMMYGNTIYYA